MKIKKYQSTYNRYDKVRPFKNIDRSIMPKKNSDKLRASKRKAPVWQRRFWEHTIRDQQDFNKHFDYIHFNPVKHGYVKKAIEWPYSTFHRYISSGIYDPDRGELSSNQELMSYSIGE